MRTVQQTEAEDPKRVVHFQSYSLTVRAVAVVVVVAVVVAVVVVAVVVAAVVVAAVVVVAVVATGSLDNFSVTTTGHWPLSCCK